MGYFQENKNIIKDFSYDIYCPKTYSHHTRITFWQPPFYQDLHKPETLARHAKKMLKGLKVKRVKDYVVGLNSRLDQYSPIHLLMLDIDTLDSSVESELKKVGGILLRSGRGIHFIGNKLLKQQNKWEAELKRIRKNRIFKDYIDKDHIDISLQRGYSTLRITSSPAKPRVPVFYKEL